MVVQRILMVCLGNICRSPMAEGILRDKIEKSGKKAIVDSAGTYGYHEGEPPDKRAIHVLSKKGIDISSLTARKFSISDFDLFEKIYVMDVSNLKLVLAMSRTEEDRQKVSLILEEVAPYANRSVPDPFYGNIEGFEEVYELLQEASEIIVKKLA